MPDRDHAGLAADGCADSTGGVLREERGGGSEGEKAGGDETAVDDGGHEAV
jgi:hypothetical protein